MICIIIIITTIFIMFLLSLSLLLPLLLSLYTPHVNEKNMLPKSYVILSLDYSVLLWNTLF